MEGEGQAVAEAAVKGAPLCARTSFEEPQGRLAAEGAAGCLSIPLTRGAVAVVDASSSALALGKWHLSGRYAAKRSRAGDHPKNVLMHRLIAGALPGQIVDHINGDTLDNRRANLRIVSSAANSLNRQRSNNNNARSEYVGVNWSRRDQKWQAQIKLKGRVKFLGYFTSLEDAVASRRAAHAAAMTEELRERMSRGGR